jgi:alcohol dehydrogenase/propanol-preferring alcohol dehydrogenase
MLGGKYEVQLPLMTLSTRTMKGCYLGSIDEMRELMDLVRAGKIESVPVETRPASQANDTLADLKNGNIKGLVCLKH